MSDDNDLDETARKITERRAAERRLMNDPLEFMAALSRVAAAGREARAAEKRRRAALAAARRAAPAAKAVRSAAARRGWETRRAKEAANAEPEWYVPAGPVCGEMSHNSIGAETFCNLEPDHDGLCDDLYGCTWDAERD